jgi:hypothetical protein
MEVAAFDFDVSDIMTLIRQYEDIQQHKDQKPKRGPEEQITGDTRLAKRKRNKAEAEAAASSNPA